MDTRTIGSLTVSQLCLGTITFGGSRLPAGSFWRDIAAVEPHKAVRLVHAALDHGITFFDTADIYGSGASEQLLGEALGGRRAGAIIATKVGAADPGEPAAKPGLERKRIINGCEASLRRLGTDVIDLFQIHNVDPETGWDEILGAFDELIRAGKVREAGCSNLSGWHLTDALACSKELGLPRFASYQGYYSLVSRDLEYEVLPACRAHGVGVTVWGPLSSGYLTGKHGDGPAPAGTRRSSALSGKVEPRVDPKIGAAVAAQLHRVAASRDSSVAAVALAWLLTREGVSSVIFGARNVTQLVENASAASLGLNEEDLEGLERASAVDAKPYPYWHQELTGVA